LAERRCTILFADLADSASLAGNLGPNAFKDLLERYYQDVTDIVFLYGGSLISASGGGTMAVFGLSDSQSDPAIKAASAAIEIAQIADARYRNGDTRLDVAVGVHTGEFTAGYVSTKERVELNVVGQAVNAVIELQRLARPNRVLISAETNSEINGAIAAQSLGEVEIEEGAAPTEVYELRTGIAAS
jgi:adenylate cyclase